MKGRVIMDSILSTGFDEEGRLIPQAKDDIRFGNGAAARRANHCGCQPGRKLRYPPESWKTFNASLPFRMWLMDSIITKEDHDIFLDVLDCEALALFEDKCFVTAAIIE